MEQLKSNGKCVFCQKVFSQAGITQHLNTHLRKQVKVGAPGISFHLQIETNPRYGKSPYFLNLWVDGMAKLQELDQFLKDIWLECCGHMSSFTDPNNKRRGSMWLYDEAEGLLAQGKIKEYEALMEDARGEIPKSRLAKDALDEDLILDYVYDFGSSTELQIKVVEVFPIRATEKIVLLSRNEPLAIMCEECGEKPALLLCTYCLQEEAENAFCAGCAKKHKKTCSDFADYASMPIVNSPRMGECGYEGGSIDLARDGIYKRPESK